MKTTTCTLLLRPCLPIGRFLAVFIGMRRNPTSSWTYFPEYKSVNSDNHVAPITMHSLAEIRLSEDLTFFLRPRGRLSRK